MSRVCQNSNIELNRTSELSDVELSGVDCIIFLGKDSMMKSCVRSEAAISPRIPIPSFGHSGNFFYRKSTLGTTIAAIEVNNNTYCLQERIHPPES